MTIQPQDTKPFYRSVTMRAVASVALAYVAGKFGQPLPCESADQIVGTASDLLFALGAPGVGLGRARACAPLSSFDLFGAGEAACPPVDGFVFCADRPAPLARGGALQFPARRRWLSVPRS